VILAVGQFIHRKGFDILLDVWSKIETKNACLIIIGSGPESRFYQEIISNNQLKNVTLIDFLEKQRLCEFYQLSDLFVFPTRYDIWGLVLNEALAFGLPVISSKQAASSWDLVVDEKNGFMVDISRQEELTCRLQSLLDNPELLKIYSQNSLDMIQNYTIENMAQRHMDIFEEIVMQSKFNTGREKNI
ncbi:MAG: glycosyltransferase family 4 protein, partial [Eubacteriales bacterium]|nr:glycosyltransferase family 4 protein [Eubacteriales bacterium]